MDCASMIPRSVCLAGSSSRASTAAPTASLRQSIASARSQAVLRASKFQHRASVSTTRVYAAANNYVQFKQNAKIVLTREAGNNGKLAHRLSALGLETIEMPLIEHAYAEDFDALPDAIKSTKYDWIMVTSPEAAKTFLEGWTAAGEPKVKMAVVGKGTGDAFQGIHAVDVAFLPSKATGKVLAAELPLGVEGERVLYPCSAKASTDVQEGLTARGFVVTRLNTYTTRNVKTVDDEVLTKAKNADVVTFASPTTIKAWVSFMGEHALSTDAPTAACIGETSASASRNAGLQKVFSPEKPGIDGWVESVLDALKQN